MAFPKFSFPLKHSLVFYAGIEKEVEVGFQHS
jgi:hypothetical protein